MKSEFISFRKIKLFLANKYLDWAEKLPKFQGGLFCSLQHIRAHQRKWSEDCYTDTRAPEGMSIKYKELVLIDVFELEDLNRLSGGLKELFPNIKRSKDLLENLEKRAGSLHSSGWHHIGMVSRSRTSISIGENTIDPTLPLYIDYVSVGVYGITPSISAIAFIFRMADEISADLNRLHDRYYLSDVEFKRMIPWGRMCGGYSENPVEAVVQRNLLKYMMGIREECEKWTSKYFKGYLQNAVRREGPSLGAIEIFEIIGAPNDGDEKLNNWKNKARNWLDTFGISIDDRVNFIRGQFTFCWHSTGREQQIIPARILVSNKYEDYHLKFIVHSLVAPMAMVSYLFCLKRSVEFIRVDVFRATKKSTQKVNKRNITNSLMLKRNVMLLDRMRLELGHNKSWFFHLTEAVNDFKSDPKYYGDSALNQVLYEHIIKEVDHIKEHGQIAEKNITDYINMQNIMVMLTLQNRMLVLTIVATLATVVSALVSYDKLIELWCMVIS